MNDSADDTPVDDPNPATEAAETTPTRHAAPSRWAAAKTALRTRPWATAALGALVLVAAVGVWAGAGAAGDDSPDTADVAATLSPRDPDAAGRDQDRPEPSASESSSPKPTTTKPSPNDPETHSEEPETNTDAADPDPEPVAGCGDFSGNQAIACGLLGDHGFGKDQMSCLVPLWDNESGWNTTAANPSGAYGIPQALPGSKMASAGDDWETSASTQITWGLGYISDRYGDPCGAWGFWQSNNYY